MQNTGFLLPSASTLLLTMLALANSACQSSPQKVSSNSDFSFIANAENIIDPTLELSHLNEPITNWLIVKDGKIYKSGKRLRLFGTSLSFGATVPDPSQAKLLAKRLRKLGINYVRLHHFDTFRAPKGIIAKGFEDSQHLDSTALQRMKVLISEFRKNGIYVGLSLLVGRRFSASDGVVDGDKIPGKNKTVSYFSDRILQLVEAFSIDLMRHFENDPTVAFIELRNEDSLVRTAVLGRLKRLPRFYQNELNQKWQAWPKSPKQFQSVQEAINDPEAAQQALQFLADLERNFCERFRSIVRKSGSRALVTCTQMTYGGAAVLYRESKMDYASITSYWDHPELPGFEWNETQWKITNRPMAADSDMGTFPEIAFHAVSGKPYFIIEYNHAAPNDSAAEALPMVAPFAQFQDVDALNLFEFGSGSAPLNVDKIEDHFNWSADPSKLAFVPLSATLFRSEEGVPDCKPTDQISLGVDFGQSFALARDHAESLSGVWKSAGISAEQSLTAILRVRESVTRPPVIARSQTCRDSFDIEWRPKNHRFSASSRRDLSIVAELQPGEISIAGPVSIRNLGSHSTRSSVMISALDRKPLSESKSIYIAAIERSENTDIVWNTDRTSVGGNWGKGPVKVWVPHLLLSIRQKSCAGLKVNYAGGQTVSNGEFNIELSPKNRSVWYRVNCED